MHPLVFLLDIDNTLYDNDAFADKLHARLARDFGDSGLARYQKIYEDLRDERDYADYLGALQQFRSDLELDPKLLRMSSFLLNFPFADLLYPQALESVAHLHTLGLPVILSDGDVVFQPRKIQRSGLWDAVEGRVLVTLHKEKQLDAMQRMYPAEHYVMVDDKPKLLAPMKKALGDRITTVFVRQGHYAAESDPSEISPAPDLVIERIGDLRHHGMSRFTGRA